MARAHGIESPAVHDLAHPGGPPAPRAPRPPGRPGSPPTPCNAACVPAAAARGVRGAARTGKMPVVQPLPDARPRRRGSVVRVPGAHRTGAHGGRPDTMGRPTRTMGHYG